MPLVVALWTLLWLRLCVERRLKKLGDFLEPLAEGDDEMAETRLCDFSSVSTDMVPLGVVVGELLREDKAVSVSLEREVVGCWCRGGRLRCC